MRVAICHTKAGVNANHIYSCFELGLRKNGDTAIHINNDGELSKLEECDALFQVAHPFLAGTEFCFCDEEWTNKKIAPSHDRINLFRVGLYRKAKKLGVRSLYLDSGLFNTDRNRSQVSNSYYQIGWDSIKGLANYYNENSPRDRWDKLNIKLNKWQLEGNHFLILSQVRFGIGSQHCDVTEVFSKVMDTIRKYTPNDCEIRIRNHPNVKGGATDRTSEKFQKQLKLKARPKIFIPHNKPISYRDFKGIRCAITFSTNAVVHGLIEGIPTICLSKVSPCYPHLYRPLDTLMDRTIVENREQILADLAYTQWNPVEIQEGEAWGHLKQFYNRPIPIR